VTYTLTHRRKEPVDLAINFGSIAEGVVCRGRRAVAMVGSTSGCFPSSGVVPIAAGEELEIRWRVTTAIQDWSGEHGFETRNAAPGRYIFRVEPTVGEIAGASAAARNAGRLPGPLSAPDPEG
jgi:hypothetical protein